MSQSNTSRTIETRSQAKKLSFSQTCTCPESQQAIPKMNENDKKEIKDIVSTLLNGLRSDFEKESSSNQSTLTQLRQSIETQIEDSQKATRLALKPEYFMGSTDEDANQWLDFYERIAAINNWKEELKLQAFPLYLQGVAGSWFLTLDDAKKASLSELKKAFKERFASGPHNWILSQQLGRRKQRPNESLDAYVIDITRLCKRLGLSDADSMRYFIEGLQGDLQVYVALQRPKNLEEAESFARMKHTINQRQGLSDSHSALTQVTTLLTGISDKLTNNTKAQSVAAISRPTTETECKRLDILAQQIDQLQQQQQFIEYGNTMAAINYYQEPPLPWQLEQLQQQVASLEDALRHYQNSQDANYRSFGRNYHSTEGGPFCSYCSRVGHTFHSCRQRARDSRLPPPTSRGPLLEIEPPPPQHSNHTQGNA